MALYNDKDKYSGYGGYDPDSNYDGYGNYGPNTGSDGYGNYGPNTGSDGYGNYGPDFSHNGYGNYGSNSGYNGYGNYNSNTGNPGYGYGSNPNNSGYGFDPNGNRNDYGSGSNYYYGGSHPYPQTYKPVKRKKSGLKILGTCIGIAALAAIVLIAGILLQDDRLGETNTAEETVQIIQNEDTDTTVQDTEPQSTDPEPAESASAVNNSLADFYYNQLTDEGKQIYTEMLAGIQNREDNIKISSTNNDEISKAFEAINLEHPELYAIHNKNVYTTTNYSSQNYSEFSPSYSYTEAEISAIDAAVEASFQEVNVQITEGMSDYDKVRTAYDWVIENIEYITSDDDQNIAGALWKREAVCAGYARSMQYFLQRLGVSVTYVTGDVPDSDVGHAWIVVDLEGENYIVDATFGDQPDFLAGNAASLEEHKTILYDYMCPFPEEYYTMAFPSSTFSTPECTSHSMNFYVLNGACFDSYDWQSVYDLCVLRIDNGAAVVRFKFADAQSFEQAKAEWINGNSMSQIAQYYMEHNGLSSVDYSYGTLDELNTIYYIF